MTTSCVQRHLKVTVTICDLDGDVTAAFSGEFRERRDSVMSALTHVDLQS